MAEPSLDSLHISQPLSNLATAFVTDESQFVGLGVAPPFPVDKVTDTIWDLDVRSMMRADGNAQGPDGYLPEIRWKDTTKTYRATRHGLCRFVLDTEENNADAMVKPSRAATRILMMRNLRTLEKSILTKMTTAANFLFNTTVPAADRFNINGSSVDAYVRTAMETPTVRPNAVLMGQLVYNTIMNHAELKEKYKYTGQGLVPDALIKQILQVDYVFISTAKYDAADERAATASYGYMMPKDLLFFYVDPTPSRESLNTAWTFWYRSGAPVAIGSRNPFYVKPTPEPRRGGGGTYYDCEAWYDEAVILNTQAAYLMKTVID